MKHSLIRYRFEGGSREEWHRHIAEFIAALDADPVLKGQIAYRCMKSRDGTEYYHLAAAPDDEAIATLNSRDFFVRYKAHTKAAAGSSLDVSPIELVAETKHRA